MRCASEGGKSPPTLEARGITVRFGAYTALRNVSLLIRPGEVTALAGPNGAGKTTLFHVLNGNLRPDVGRVLMDGADVTGLKPWKMARRGVGRMFQDVRTFSDLTVRENVESALSVGGDCRDEAGHWLEYAGLADAAGRRASQLSLVERRLLAMARMLALKSRLILLDEPMAGLPAAEADRIAGFVRRLADERGVSVALVEHDLGKVRQLADTVCFLHEGKVMVSGAPGDVFADERVRALYADDQAAAGVADGAVRFTDSDSVAYAAGGELLPGVSALRTAGNVFPSLTVADNLALALWGQSRRAVAARRGLVARMFPFLFERMEQKAGTLSGGQRQALAIAMVMCRDARLYFFDGPSAGLAPRTAATMFRAIAAFAQAEPDREVYVRESRLAQEGGK